MLGMSASLAQAAGLAGEPDLTFLLTFNKNSVVADRAGGNRSSTTFHDNLEFRTAQGVDGTNAFILKKGETLKYTVKGNIDHRQGTLSLWLKAVNYDPGKIGPPGPERSHASFVNVLFKNGKHWVRFYLFEDIDNPMFYFYWHNSWCGPQDYKTAGASAAEIHQGQWFHLTMTWTLDKIQLYLNGNLRGEVRLPRESELSRDMTPLPAESFIGICDPLWAGSKTAIFKETAVDDVRIYSRPLTSIEIKRIYLASAPKSARPSEPLPDIDMQLNGVDDGIGPLDRLRVDLDYHPMTPDWLAAIASGTVQAKIILKSPSGKEFVDQWRPASLREFRILHNCDTAGRYMVTVTLTDSTGRSNSAEKTIIRPNTEWFKNGIGMEDEVPAPWTPISVSGDNVVKVWGRTYDFGQSPLPRQVTHTGDPLLIQGPQLQVQTADGMAKIKYEITGRKIHNSYVEFTGKGTARDFWLSGTTRVDFDGLVRWDFVIHGKPLIRSMKLTWKVDRRFCDYLLDPLLLQAGNGAVQMPFPTDTMNTQRSTVLWLTSDKKGFCWVPEDDANWVYSGKPISVDVSSSGGLCTLDMIQRPTRIPEGTPYHAMFIGTPSRPLPRISRTFRLGGFGSQSNCDVAILQEGGDGLESRFTFAPASDFGQYMQTMRARGVRRGVTYGSPTALNDICPEGIYFHKYWDIPGGPSYSLETGCVHYQSINTCPTTRFSDYILWNMRKLFENPDQMCAGIYYDLVLNYTCANPLHGCSFKDRFGRTINRLIVMGLRRILMRTLKLCHKTGRVVILHGHSYYNPAFDAFGDYWFPGEQYTSMIQSDGPYFYSDRLDENIYRSELNKNIKGSDVIFNGSLKRANPAYGTEEQTLAMLTKLLLNDISVAMAYEDESVINRIWGIALKYQLDDAHVVLYYDPDNVVKSNNPAVVVTYYRCPDGRILAIIGNLTAREQTAQIDLLPLNGGLSRMRDEYTGEIIDAPEGKLTVTLKPRLFRIVGF